MRIIACHYFHGTFVQDVLDQLNELWAKEFGIKDSDIISLSVGDTTTPMSIHTNQRLEAVHRRLDSSTGARQRQRFRWASGMPSRM